VGLRLSSFSIHCHSLQFVHYLLIGGLELCQQRLVFTSLNAQELFLEKLIMPGICSSANPRK